MLREELPPARLADLVARPADALQATAHRTRRLDLDDEVDRTHVDAELERRGGDQALELAPLELVLDEEPALAAERAVVGHHQLVAGLGRGAGGLSRAVHPFEVQLVEPGGQPLGQAPGVHEDDGGAVLLDQLQQAGVQRRPDRAAHRAAGCGAADRLVDDLAQRAHVLDRHDDLDVEGLAHPGVDDGDRTRLPRGAVVAGEEPGDLVERALGGRQPDALDGRVGDGVESLEGEREVGAPLGGGQGVDLVDDHGLDAAEVLPGRRREHQVERLGGGDEQVGRVAQHAAALVGGGVAGAHAHDRRVERLAQALGGEADAGQRRPQVLLDVDRQGPQRGDVDQPGAVLAVVGRRRRHQAVEAPEEGGEGLAGAGGGQHQGVVARRDGRPALGLRRGGLGEGGGEPGADRRREAFERVGRGHPVEATDA